MIATPTGPCTLHGIEKVRLRTASESRRWMAPNISQVLLKEQQCRQRHRKKQRHRSATLKLEPTIQSKNDCTTGPDLAWIKQSSSYQSSMSLIPPPGGTTFYAFPHHPASVADCVYVGTLPADGPDGHCERHDRVSHRQW